MPLLVTTEELQAGMKLHEPVFASGQLLLQGGRLITRLDVENLRRRYPALRVRVADPVLDNVLEFEDDARERDVATTAQKRVSECLSEVHQRFAQRTSISGVDVALVQATVSELMQFLKENRTTAALVASCMDSSSYLGVHAGNVFYLSMLLGSAVLDYVVGERRRQIRAHDVNTRFAHDLTPLGLAALVMDLGMVPLQQLLRPDKFLTEDERAAIRAHPNVGFELLPETFSAVARAVVKTHHENYCGTGYPRQLNGERLHVFARILRIADAYDAATTTRVYRGAKTPARVIWEMSVGPYRECYDPVLIEAFSRLIQPFPIGAKLRLRDGRYAVVIRYNRTDPFDPIVVIAFDANNHRLPRGRLQGPLALSARRELRIASFEGDDLSFIYDAARDLPEPPVRGKFQTPLQASYP